MKKNIIRKAREAGHLISPDILDMLTEDVLDDMLSPTAPLVITTLQKQKKRKTLTITDVSAYYKKRFDTLQTILSEKTESVSISHLATNNRATIIGMVQAVGKGTATLDDTTGTIGVATEETLYPGDVIAVTGYKQGEIFKAQAVQFPNIPLQNIPPTFTEPIHLEPTTEAAQIKKGKLSILQFPPETPYKKEEVSTWLQRRYFPNTPTINDPLLLEPLPHIIWLIQNSEWQLSYKGVVVLSSPEPLTINPDFSTTKPLSV